MTNIPVLVPSDFQAKDGFGKFARGHALPFAEALFYALVSSNSIPGDGTTDCHLTTNEGYFGAVVRVFERKEYVHFSFKEKI
ncbi:hypothetical protein HZB69_00445 [Candidatus Amesbacteria bacterium]|nr:hypothetical protein [Candidatus Amesbacteria bacterium]